MPIIVPPTADMQHDDEQFCPNCFAVMESSEHHEKCVRPLDRIADVLAYLDEADASALSPAAGLSHTSSRTVAVSSAHIRALLGGA